MIVFCFEEFFFMTVDYQFVSQNKIEMMVFSLCAHS